MIDRFEILASRIRYLVSRNRWSARLLGYRPVPGHGDEPGVILVQVDGLGEAVLARALREGRMPFTRHLLEDEGYEVRSLYSGMASNTPNFQAELFYGVKGAVPGFGFVDAETGREFAMNQHAAAAAIESRIRKRGDALLSGGSAWSDIYSGGAAEAHLCASTVGLPAFLRALNPLRILGLVVWHGWSVVRVLANFLAEIAFALWGFVRGTMAGREFRQELKFIPERVAVSALMREIATAGACIDAERGLPIIHMNLLGYDEHAHRRGPDSGFALWTLRGLDKSIRRIWLAAHRSRYRDYQIWIYSDHGQEPVTAYAARHGGDVADRIHRIWSRLCDGEPQPRPGSSAASDVARSSRSQWLGPDVPSWMGGSRDSATAPGDGEHLSEELSVVHRGPVGFAYVSGDCTPELLHELAEAMHHEARAPTVMVADPGGGAFCWTGGKKHHLPEDAAEVFGADHPYLDSLPEDTLRLVRHESAGAVAFFGWSRTESLSFKVENGAHGGPGPRETSAFLILPPEIADQTSPGGTLRPIELRELVLRVLDPSKRHLPSITAPPAQGRRLRVMTYNVHGCRGMDGRYSVQRVARVIARARPDIVCLQELDQERPRSGGVDQALEIAAQLETEFHFHPVREADDGRFGNAVLSLYPLSVVKRGDLPRLSDRLNLEDRGVLWVEVDVGGRKIQVVNTHLSILRRERELQVEALVGEAWLGGTPASTPLLLAGDFNAVPRSRAMRRIGEILRDVTDAGPVPRALRTWSGSVPLRRIDHVFTAGGLEVVSIRVPRTRLSRVASDHLPLVVDLELPDAFGRPEA